MDDFGPASYGDAFADVYDRWYREVTDVAACVARLAELVASATPDGTPNGPVLELGVGTGRLALPLARRGLAVTGVDASADMLARLAAKPGADRLTLVEADMADLDGSTLGPPAEGAGFALVFVAYNTLFNLPDGDAQRRCLAAVADRLAPGGRLVLETFVPEPVVPAERLTGTTPITAGPRIGAGGEAVAVSRVAGDEVVLTASRHDPAAQAIVGRHIQITAAGTRVRPWRVHYLHPDELEDLLGQVGLVPLGRWRDWQRHPFDQDSPVLISISAKP